MNATAINADPDGAGALTSGYDDVFRESLMLPSGGSQRGVDARVGRETLVDIPFQEDVERMYNSTREAPFFTGASPDADVWIVLHFTDLERLSLVDAVTGDPLIRPDDRLVSVHDYKTAALIQTIRTPPGLYVREVIPNFGLRGTRNLLFLRLRARELSTRQGG